MIAAVSIPRPVTPLGILVRQLDLLLQQLGRDSEHYEALQASWQLAAGLDPYLQACTTAESEALATLAERTAQEAWTERFETGSTVRPLEQEMLSGHVEGQLLKLFVHMLRANRVLEIGMFTGYSALAMAEALPEMGELVACEVDPYTAAFAQSCFAASPHGRKIRVEVGAALDTLHRLAAAGECFELVFIDADKREYLAYLELLLSTSLLAAGGMIAVDNTLLQGQPYLPADQRSPNGEAIAQFNRAVAADPRVEQVMLPLRDGLTLIRRV